jgi:hypothetical protein
MASTDPTFARSIRKKESDILRYLEKKHKVVPIHYYRKLWFVLGMTAFGLPIGVAIGMSLGNIGLLGVGLPIGMAIGFGVGSRLDKKHWRKGVSCLWR